MKTLPNKWCVQRTNSNFDILNNWANSVNPGAHGHSSRNQFIHSENFGAFGWSGNGHYYADDKHEDFTEITFEQFKYFILESNVEKFKESYDYLIPLIKILENE